jgi:hypothetical protein
VRIAFTFYRVTYSANGGNSAGYSWHASRRAALAAAKKDYDQDPAEYDNHFAGVRRLDTIRVVPTKAGILAALGQYASHPDNG